MIYFIFLVLVFILFKSKFKNKINKKYYRQKSIKLINYKNKID